MTAALLHLLAQAEAALAAGDTDSRHTNPITRVRAQLTGGRGMSTNEIDDSLVWELGEIWRGNGEPVTDSAIIYLPDGGMIEVTDTDEAPSIACEIMAMREAMDALKRIINPAPGVAKLPAWVYGIAQPVIAKVEAARQGSSHE